VGGEQAPAVLSTRKRNRHDRPLLCGVDATAGGRAVVSIAGALAARLHAPLILVHVDSDGEPRSARTGERALRLLDTSYMRSLRGVEVRTRWEYGDPTTRLLDMVEQENARLLLVGSRGRGRFTRALLGSVSTAVAARATSPVCVVPSDEDWSAHPDALDGPVLCGIDESDGAITAARYGSELAGALGAEVRLAHVLPTGTGAAMPTSSGVTPLTLELVAEHERQRALRLLDRVRRAAGIATNVRLYLARGEPAEGLDALAEDQAAGLVVVASRGRAARRAALLGSASATLAATGRRPVLVLSPIDQAAPARSATA